MYYLKINQFYKPKLDENHSSNQYPTKQHLKTYINLIHLQYILATTTTNINTSINITLATYRAELV